MSGYTVSCELKNGMSRIDPEADMSINDTLLG